MRGIGILTALLLLAGCASPPTHFYTLEPIPPTATTVQRSRLSSPIEIGDVAVPSVIDRDSIVLSAGDDRLEVSSQNQWGAPVNQLIRQALIANLADRLSPGSVLAPGSPAPQSGIRVLSLQVTHFMGDTAGHVVLDVDWSLIRGGSSTVVRHGQEMIEVRAASGHIEAVVPAMSKALAELSDRLTTRLAA